MQDSIDKVVWYTGVEEPQEGVDLVAPSYTSLAGLSDGSPAASPKQAAPKKKRYKELEAESPFQWLSDIIGPMCLCAGLIYSATRDMTGLLFWGFAALALISGACDAWRKFLESQIKRYLESGDQRLAKAARRHSIMDAVQSVMIVMMLVAITTFIGTIAFRDESAKESISGSVVAARIFGPLLVLACIAKIKELIGELKIVIGVFSYHQDALVYAKSVLEKKAKAAEEAKERIAKLAILTPAAPEAQEPKTYSPAVSLADSPLVSPLQAKVAEADAALIEAFRRRTFADHPTTPDHPMAPTDRRVKRYGSSPD